jgi:hypothetical protein
MRRTTKNKTIAATAFLLFLLIIAFLVPHFLGNLVDACGRHKPPHHHPRPPPLGKSYTVTFVYPDGTPIGAGLEVTLVDSTFVPQTKTTDADGKVVFTGLEVETYTIKYSWQGEDYSKPLPRVECTKAEWTWTEEVPYWTVEKTFYYAETTDPIVNLTVKLDGKTGITDASGFVSFADVKAGEHTLEWVWNGLPANESVSIGFADETPYVVPDNYLEPKSGGDK